jgi:hypothetical protein
LTKTRRKTSSASFEPGLLTGFRGENHEGWWDAGLFANRAIQAQTHRVEARDVRNARHTDAIRRPQETPGEKSGLAARERI